MNSRYEITWSKTWRGQFRNPVFSVYRIGLRIVCKLTFGQFVRGGLLRTKRRAFASMLASSRNLWSLNSETAPSGCAPSDLAVRAGRRVSLSSLFPRSAASGSLDGRGKTKLDQGAGCGRALRLCGHLAGCPGTGCTRPIGSERGRWRPGEQRARCDRRQAHRSSFSAAGWCDGGCAQ